MPVRLRVLAEIEANLVTKADEPLRLNLGFADRFQLVSAALDKEKTPINQIFLNEPMALLPEYLKNKGFNVVFVREPGGTNISEKIRDIILDIENKEMCYITEALLYASSRAQLVNEVINPKLKQGAIVICDRFVVCMI